MKNRRANVYTGFGLYDRPLLASYSRSGTNWIRYIIEYCSNCPTPGQRRLHDGNNYYIDRAHCAYTVMNQYKKVILVIRNYKECILRHHKKAWPKYSNIVSMLTDEELRQPASWYIKNIDAFDKFEEEKLLIYYEDLLENPLETILDLSVFIGLDKERSQLLLDDIDAQYQNSVAAYTRGGHRSETSATKDLNFHARTKLTKEEVREFDDFYFTNHHRLANKYLRRYFTRSE